MKKIRQIKQHLSGKAVLLGGLLAFTILGNQTAFAHDLRGEASGFSPKSTDNVTHVVGHVTDVIPSFVHDVTHVTNDFIPKSNRKSTRGFTPKSTREFVSINHDFTPKFRHGFTPEFVPTLHINRSSVADCYRLIISDLSTAATYMGSLNFAKTAVANRRKATSWAAKALLAKVYLTLNLKADAVTQLQDVITNSGHSLQATYANVFAITNEMNSEILFAVRFKAGGLGLGTSFGNDFAALNSGSAIINGSGRGFNYPTPEFDSAYIATDTRKAATIATFGTGAATQSYVKKLLNPVVLTDDGEADFPILRYADVLLMLAEAQGFSPVSITLINQVRTRTALGNLPATVNTVELFEQALSNERRFEFAFEHQRWFDLLRFNTTLTTIKAEDVLKSHFSKDYAKHYGIYPAPRLTLLELQNNVTPNKLLLPIPQREIDTNTGLKIEQNPGY